MAKPGTGVRPVGLEGEASRRGAGPGPAAFKGEAPGLRTGSEPAGIEVEAPRPRSGSRAAGIVVGAGVVCALNFGKLPPALASLRDDFGLSLVEASWMVSLFMFAAALFGIAGGAIADRFEPRRVMAVGLGSVGLAGVIGALSESAVLLFLSRGIESFGFLLAVLPGPALLRGLVPAQSLRGWLGVWSAYMPSGMGAALILTPWLMAAGGWRIAWWACALTALAWAGLIAFGLPRRGGTVAPAAARRSPGPARNAWSTATSTGP